MTKDQVHVNYVNIIHVHIFSFGLIQLNCEFENMLYRVMKSCVREAYNKVRLCAIFIISDDLLLLYSALYIAEYV